MGGLKRKSSIPVLFISMFVCVLAYLLLGECLLPADDWGRADALEEYRGSWVRVMPDGKRVPIEVPGRCDSKRGETITVETTLPETINQDTYFCFRSAKQDLKIYVDTELRLTYSTKGTRIFGRDSAVANVFFEIHGADAGKKLRIISQTDSSYSGIFYTVYKGTQTEIWQYYFKQYGSELIVAFVLLILSVMVILGSITLELFYHRHISLVYLGWGILIAGIWLVVNSVFRQLLFPNLSVVNDLAFYMIMLLPFPYLLYLDEIQQERYHMGYSVLEWVAVVDFVICTALHVLQIRDFTDTITYMALICIATIGFMAITIFIDIGTRNIWGYRYVAVGILCAFAAAMVQIIVYFRRTSLFNGVVFAVGLIVLLAFATINTIREIMQIESEKQRALSASESKGRFLANMSHEIRTPINAVLGMDEMILRETSEPKIKEYALDIRNAGQNLLSLINDILDLSKIESGKLEIISLEYDFSSLLHDVINMVSMKAEDKDLMVDLKVDETLPSRLWGDDVRIRQILVNLMNNAVKYTEHGGVTLAVSGAKRDNMIHLCFEVRDTGIGIKEEDLGKLFQEFARIEEERNRHIEGTGLGMSITTRLLQLMGSRLQVDSVYGEGSVFSFELDQQIMDEEPIGDLEARMRDQAQGYTYQRSFIAPEADLLVVDDNAVNRKVFISLLKDTGVRIDEAEGGMVCLEKAAMKQYDIIFLDHMMPDLDGIETLHRIQEMGESPNANTPVIALTANAVSGAKEMYLAEGFRDFISKPIHPEKLEKMIAEYLPEGKIADGDIGCLTEKRSKQGSAAVELPETFPDIEGVDWEYAVFRMGDAGILYETAQDFYEMMTEESETLEHLWNNMDDAEGLRQYRVKVHAMKSSAAMIGAMSLAGLAKTLEYAARDAHVEKIDHLTPVFLAEWRKMWEKLKIMFPQDENVEAKLDMDIMQLREYFKLLQSSMEDMDIDTADEIVRQIQRYRYTEEQDIIIDGLAAAVRNIDVDQTVVLIERLEKAIEVR